METRRNKWFRFEVNWVLLAHPWMNSQTYDVIAPNLKVATEIFNETILDGAKLTYTWQYMDMGSHDDYMDIYGVDGQLDLGLDWVNPA